MGLEIPQTAAGLSGNGFLHSSTLENMDSDIASPKIDSVLAQIDHLLISLQNPDSLIVLPFMYAVDRNVN